MFLLILTVRSISDAMRDNVLPQRVLKRTSTKLIYIQFLFFLVAISAGYHNDIVSLAKNEKELNLFDISEGTRCKRTVIFRKAAIVKCVSRTFVPFYIAYIIRMQCHQYINFIQSITCKYLYLKWKWLIFLLNIILFDKLFLILQDLIIKM